MSSPYNKLDLSIFGGSHETSIGMTLDGIPVGTKIDMAKLSEFMSRRKSGKYAYSTPRHENDEVIFTEGVDSSVVTGKIKAEIKNENIKSSDYNFSTTPRPSHADYVSVIKYGKAFPGGGPFSGRMTAPLCIAGGIAKQILSSYGIEVLAYISNIGEIDCYSYDNGIPKSEEIKECHDYDYPTPNREIQNKINDMLQKVAVQGESVGGSIECIVLNAPAGLGGPQGEGLEGKIAMALFGIPAVKAVESGVGKKIGRMYGIVANDPFIIKDNKVMTLTNNAGGINGGISNGMPITVRATFRPTPSISEEQYTVDLNKMEETTIKIGGRHDVAFLPRAVAPVESAVSLVILDAMLENNLII